MFAKRKEEKYQLKCIEYFLENEIVVYGNICTMYHYIPLTFLKIRDSKKIEVDIKTWEELYKNKEHILNMIKSVTKGE